MAVGYQRRAPIVAVGNVDGVAVEVGTVGHGIAERPDVEARCVVDFDADRVEREAADRSNRPREIDVSSGTASINDDVR